MARCPFAEWRGPIPNQSTGVTRPARGLVLHVIVGSLASADSAFHNPAWQASAHFGIGKDGHIVQWVDTADKAWAQAAGNPYWYSVETEGQPTEPLTPAQVEACARLLLWLHQQDGFPLQVTDDVNGQGLISHRCGGAAWGGHPCPGDQRHAQRGEVVARAKAMEHPYEPAPPANSIAIGQTTEDGMTPHNVHVAKLDAQGNGYVDLGDVSAVTVVSIIGNGQDPAGRGYGNCAVYDREDINGITRVNIHGGVPNGGLDFTVWTTP